MSANPDQDLFLGLDFGTQSVKALVYKPSSSNESALSRFCVLAQASSGHIDVDRPDGVQGGAEQHPEVWIRALKEAIAEIRSQDASILNRIRCIGVSGQQHGLVALDAQGAVIRPCMLWCDTRARAEAEELSAVANWPIPSGFTAPKILWYKLHEPEHFEKTAKIMLPHDFINYFLSGGQVFAMECGDASGMGLFKPKERDFDPHLMNYIDADLHLKLPSRLAAPDECIGAVARTVVDELFPGFPADKTILISPGSGDNTMCALGSGVGMPGSSVVVSLGTSGTLFSCSKGLETDPLGYVAPFCDATGRWLPLTCVQNCTLVPEEVVAYSGRSREDLTVIASTEAPGCGGVFMLPYISEMGERTPNWPHASGAIIGLRIGHLSRPGLLYRCALEGVGLALYRGYCRMLELGMTAPREMKLIGGGSSNDLWCQILADIFQLPVRRPQFADHAGALGAALHAASCSMQIPVGEYVHRVFSNSSSGPEDPVAAASTSTGGALKVENGRGELYDFVPNAAHKSVYETLYRKHVAISDAIYNDPVMR